MPQFELTLPKMGESVAEATMIKWLKQVGEHIHEDETVVEIATDKVDSEVPSPVAGKLLKIMFGDNEVAQVGDVIAIIETEKDDAGERKADVSTDSVPAVEAKKEEDTVVEIETVIPGLEQIGAPIATPKDDNSLQASSHFYSPLVRSIAKEEGISVEQLHQIKGSGAEGRVNKQDILEYVKNRLKPANSVQETAAKAEAQPFLEAGSVAVSGRDEVVEMDRMRKKIAEHMKASLDIAAHVTSFVESDVTSIVKWREKHKANFEKKIGEKITYTPIFIQAVARAIRDFPMINISLDGTQIIKKADINIGMAAALPSGNLIVPVIKRADQLNLVGLAKAVNDLASRSKSNKLQPDEVTEGTFTVTNIGSFGNIMGTPIINQPQVAILAIGTIEKKPAVIETEFGDMVGIRHKMYLSLSYDHRIVDGALGGRFLKRISDYLEAWDINYDAY